MKNKSHNLKKPEMIAVLSSLLLGVLVHAYALMNVLQNHDNIYAQPSGYGTGLSSGRWTLTILGDLVEFMTGGFNSPLMGGLIFLSFLAASVYFIVSMFHLHNRLSAAMVGMTFMVFPTVVSTMFYRFTAGYYGLSIFLAVLAAWILVKNKYGFFYSAIFTAISLGIYQAYFPLTVSLLVLYLIKQALIEDINWKQLFIRGIYFCGSLILGLILYFGILHLCLYLYETELSAYQGLDSIGKITLPQLLSLIKDSFITFFQFPYSNEFSLSPIPLISWTYGVLNALTAIIGIYSLIIKKRKVSLTLMILLLFVVFPIAADLIIIMCPNSAIDALMVYSLVTILFAPVVLLETLVGENQKITRFRHIMTRAVVTTLSVMIIAYTYMANVNYTAAYFANRQTENYLNSLVAQVRMTEGFTPDMQWAFIGKFEDSLIAPTWGNVPVYSGNSSMKRLINSYSRNYWFVSYLGYQIPFAPQERIAELKNLNAVKEMPYWPAEGSVKVIDGTIVLKLSE